IRATNRLPVFYNASVIQVPSMEDVRMLGIRYLIVHQGQSLPPGIGGEVVASDGGYRLVELEGWEPRVSVVPSWTVVGGAEALERVLERGFDPALTAVVEGDPGIAPAPIAGPPGSATYHEERPEDVRIRAETAAPSLVLVRNAWDRGWSATVDGEPARVLRADHFLQAVPVSAGAHQIRLVYREPAIARGIAGSAVVWLVPLVGIGVATEIRRRRAPTRRPAPPPDA
ncbi:MAG TPA: YfhO family protein, partial [Actinomycetota bacterium]|nr:YfhO family protein [Actinomycetota bacterium]